MTDVHYEPLTFLDASFLALETRSLHMHVAGVALFEAESWIGGRARTDRVEGFSIDAGAQLFGSMFTRFDSLVREVGLGSRLLRSPGRDALWRDGRARGRRGRRR